MRRSKVALTLLVSFLVVVALATCERQKVTKPSAPSAATPPTTRDTLSCEGPFSIANQEPITCVPSPNSLFAKRLPSDVMSHRMADDVDVAVHALNANAG